MERENQGERKGGEGECRGGGIGDLLQGLRGIDAPGDRPRAIPPSGRGGKRKRGSQI